MTTIVTIVLITIMRKCHGNKDCRYLECQLRGHGLDCGMLDRLVASGGLAQELDPLS